MHVTAYNGRGWEGVCVNGFHRIQVHSELSMELWHQPVSNKLWQSWNSLLVLLDPKVVLRTSKKQSLRSLHLIYTGPDGHQLSSCA